MALYLPHSIHIYIYIYILFCYIYIYVSLYLYTYIYIYFFQVALCIDRNMQLGSPASFLPPSSFVKKQSCLSFASAYDRLNVFLGDPFPTYLLYLFVKQFVRSNEMYIKTRWHVSIQRKQYLVMMRFLIFMSILTLLGFAKFSQFVSSNIYVKNGIF